MKFPLATRLLCVASLAAVVCSVRAAAPINFDRDIRPIFSDNCFTCHGPDDAKRKSGLRLDRKQGAFSPAKSGERAIVPGDLAHSELVARITATNDDDRMPPPSTGKKLTSQQIDLLKAWIQSGADWPTHWAFVAPVRPPVPPVKEPAQAHNEIDNFVLARLDKEGLKPSPEADKPTLVRRASLDITGLPPTLDEVDSFLADGSADAYDKLVDRLMTWPQFGEQQARYWLDAVRYADTHGYHIDSRRDMWKYRDWVIDAFNSDMPFDEFTTEQLAGDLLPNATLSQKIASGYNRANMTTGEGGAIEEEYRAKYTFDRVETTGAVYLGMTLMCARCHSHKYDPIQQREYYSLYAIFNQLADPVMDQNIPNPEPFVKVPSPEQSRRLDWLKQHLEEAQRQVDAPRPELDQPQALWQEQWAAKLAAGWVRLAPVSAQSLLTNQVALHVLADQSVLAQQANPESSRFELRFRLEPGVISALRLEVLPSASQGSSNQASAFALSELEAELVRSNGVAEERKPEKLSFARAVADSEMKEHEVGRVLDGKLDTSWQLPANVAGAPHAAVFVTKAPLEIESGTELVVRLRCEDAKTKAPLAHFRLAAATGEEMRRYLHPPTFSNWEVLGPLKASVPSAALRTSFEPEKQIDLKKKFPGVREEVGWSERPDLEDGQAHLLVQDLHGVHGVRYLYRTITVPAPRPVPLSFRADGLFRIWLNGQLVGERDHEETPGEGPLAVELPLTAGENHLLVKLVTIQGAAYFTCRPDLGSADALTADIATVLATGSNGTDQNQSKLRNYFRRYHSTEYRTAADHILHWTEEQQALDRAIPTTLVAKESEKPRDTFLLTRGEYDKKAEKVLPGVPSIFPPIPKGWPTNRLGLAKWLVDPSHPLTARVTVNRIWQQYFGVGLVKTTEDFGMQGEHPSNPELLDWLATEFIQSGWNLKHIHRLILTSATYRQSARASAALIARDPENRLLARGPRFRLDAEAIRDTALFLGGLLSDKVGGRSVRPYEPPGLWEAVSFNNSQRYVQDTGEAQYRRSVYTFWKRQSPPPTMLLFDAPTRESCTLRRSRSNTPLQALALLNDPQFVEASRGLAQRILSDGGNSVEARLSYAFRLATARPPTSDELGVLRRLLEQELSTYHSDSAAAAKLLSVGSSSTRPGLDPTELAAWTTVASLILILDETITKG